MAGAGTRPELLSFIPPQRNPWQLWKYSFIPPTQMISSTLGMSLFPWKLKIPWSPMSQSSREIGKVTPHQSPR